MRCPPRAVLSPWRVILVLSALSGLWSHAVFSGERPAPPPRTRGPALEVAFRDGLLSVEAHHAPWGTVLREVQRRTGIDLHLHVPLEGSVTTSFAGLPVERAFRRLFGPEASFIFRYRARQAVDPASERPVAVWVVSRTGAEAPVPHGPSATPAAPRSAGGMAAPEADPELGSEFDTDPHTAQAMALDAADPEVRLAAIAHLGRQAQPAAVSVLLDVVQDPDPHVRQSALEALLPLLDEAPYVRAGLTQVLHTAQDAEVRQLLADALGIALDSGADQGAFEAAPEGVSR
jgi:HEAT repeats